MVATEPIIDEEKLQHRYLRASKFLFLLTVIYSLWTALVIMVAFFLQQGSKWAVLTIEQWILSAIVLIGAVIGLEVIFLLHYLLTKKKHQLPEKQKQSSYIQGKELVNFTVPLDAKGGIFSKTYILIDETKVLNIRYQMIPSNDLWGQKQ
ncbi:MAG TPA: hypothetical protein DSN98_03940 [Thermoplasmata archaeon]|jgi:hypothetical protein|nr:MAG TPA: hypothetical protein DSN98_03940 [Thermoplasmata archaeon]